LNYEFNEYARRNQKADLIRQKFEVITREYSDMNKQFSVRHEEIKLAEVEKRG